MLISDHGFHPDHLRPRAYARTSPPAPPTSTASSACSSSTARASSRTTSCSARAWWTSPPPSCSLFGLPVRPRHGWPATGRRLGGQQPGRRVCRLAGRMSPARMAATTKPPPWSTSTRPTRRRPSPNWSSLAISTARTKTQASRRRQHRARAAAQLWRSDYIGCRLYRPGHRDLRGSLGEIPRMRAGSV